MSKSLKDLSPRWLKDIANVTTRRYALMTSGDRPGPDFLIIGCKRGGTTSLFNYLLMHPGVLGLFPRNREKKSTDYFFSHTYVRGGRWYQSHFHSERYRTFLARRLGYRPLGGEASPYYCWDPRIAERVVRTSQTVKAIMLVRDPVERAWSHYLERVQNGVEPLDFEDALAAEPERLAGELDRMMSDASYHSTEFDWYSYRSRGDYLPQIRRWESILGRDKLLVLRSEDLYSDTQQVVNEVFEFIGVPRFDLPTEKVYNASRLRRDMPEGAASDLRHHFAPKVKELEAHLGRSLGWSLGTRLAR